MRKPMFNKTPLALAVGAALSATALTPPVLACTPDASSQTFTVNTVDDSDDSNDGVTSLREAISAANSAAGCDIVNFDLPENSTVMVNTANSLINVSDDINIQGPGAAQLIISHVAVPPLSEVLFGSGSLIRHTAADVSLSDVTLSNAFNSAIVSTASDLTVERVVISDNRAFRGAGIRFLEGTNNNLVIRDSVISNNEAIDRGGALDIPNSFASGLIENSTIENNTSQTVVGGILIFENDPDSFSVPGEPVVPDDEVDFVIRDSIIRGNSALEPVEGGLAGGLYFSNSSNSNNVTLSIENSQISNNDAIGDNGGVHVFSSDDMTINITQTTFADNIINPNPANGFSCNGAGLRLNILNGSVDLTINDSTFSGNRVEGDCASDSLGGGIYVSGGESSGLLSSSSVITQSTFSGNAADQGGALYIETFSSLNIAHSTITDNTAENGGGIFYNAGLSALTLSNSIVAGNTATVADPDLRGLFNAGFSFIGVDSANASITDTGGSVLNGGDPGLGALQDPPFSSRTQQVHVPAADSAVLDAGDASLSAGVGDTPLLDQTGRSRIVGDQIDIGSVERNNNRPPVQSPAIDAATAQVGVEFTLALNNFFSDPDGDSLTFTILNPTELPAAIMLNGSVVSGTFAAEDVGEYTVQYQACDAEGFCITGDGALTVVPAASDSSGDAGSNDNTNSGGGGGGGGSLGLGWLSLLSLLLWRRRR